MRVVVISPFRRGNTAATHEQENADIIIGHVKEDGYDDFVLLQNKIKPVGETGFLLTDAQRNY